jgi:hypothetical protein
VGKTTNMAARLNEHFTSGGSAWTRRHPPVERVDPIVDPSPDLESTERAETLERMWAHGIENVRGWRYTTATLTESDAEDVFNQMCERKDLCRKCGRDGHMIASCTSRDLAKWIGNNRLLNREMALHGADTRRKRIADGMDKKKEIRVSRRDKKATKMVPFVEVTHSDLSGGYPSEGSGVGALWSIAEDLLLYRLRKENAVIGEIEQAFEYSRTPNALKSRVKRLMDPNHEASRRLAPLISEIDLNEVRRGATLPAASTVKSAPTTTPAPMTVPMSASAPASVPISVPVPLSRGSVPVSLASTGDAKDTKDINKTPTTSKKMKAVGKSVSSTTSVPRGAVAEGGRKRASAIFVTAARTFLLNVG